MSSTSSSSSLSSLCPMFSLFPLSSLSFEAEVVYIFLFEGGAFCVKNI